MTKWLRSTLCSTLVLSALACGNESPPPVPGSFDRPGKVAFVCFQTSGAKSPRPLPMSYCVGQEGEEKDKANIAMHALVTQTSRGEVAAVDLEKRRVLDSRQDIPGYSFLPVGELPSAIAVPRARPEVTYVSNFGSRTITLLRTRAFRELPVGDDPTLQTVEVHLPGSKEPLAPTDMLLSPDEDALFVAVPDASAVLRMPIVRCTSDDEDAGTCLDGLIDESGVTRVTLDASLALATTPKATGVDAEPYAFVCDPSALLPAPERVTAVIDAAAKKLEPAPIALAVDAFCKKDTTCTRRLLVADRTLPIIHAFDIDALTQGADGVLPPVVTGVPTLAVAVTPRVPKSLDAADGETQYVYAIDATDGSVIATQDGRVLSVNSDPTTRPDRIALGDSYASGSVNAISLSVLHPDFDVQKTAAQYASTTKDPLCDDSPTDRSDLRGVFLAVGGTDGTVRIVDVHDMELKECRSCDKRKPDPYPVLRNHTRIAASYDTTAALPRTAPLTRPSFGIGDSFFGVDLDGTTRDPRFEGLSCLPCAAPLIGSFPDPSDLVGLQDAGIDKDAGPIDETITNPDAGLDASLDGGLDTEDMDAAVGGRITQVDLCPEGEARVCALGDPWAVVQSWTAGFEGTIPGTNGGHGRFVEPSDADNVSGKLEFAGEVAFCESGVQGKVSDSRKIGDQLVITSALPPDDLIDSSIRDDCHKLIDTREDSQLIAFPILDVAADRVQIGDRLTNKSAPQTSYEFVARCFANMLVTFDVRTHRAYTVLGDARTGHVGFLHRNMLDKAGHCVIDESQNELRHGRAYEDEIYVNEAISFKIASRRNEKGEPKATTPFTTLYLSVNNNETMPKVILDASGTQYDRIHGVLPVDLRYNDTDQTLYMVDQTARGLIPISLNGFPSGISSSYE